jgi:hypothetical protein
VDAGKRVDHESGDGAMSLSNAQPQPWHCLPTSFQICKRKGLEWDCGLHSSSPQSLSIHEIQGPEGGWVGRSRSTMPTSTPEVQFVILFYLELLQKVVFENKDLC